MNVIPAALHARGSAGFSERKPYPGWMAVHASFLGECHDAFDVEVRLDRPLALPNQIRFVGLDR